MTPTPFIVNATSFPAARIATFASLLNIILPLLTIGAALLLLVMLLYGAFSWITAGDNIENIKKGQKILTYAVFGMIIVVLSYAMVKLIATIFNINAPI